jgi:hypothetical protein
VEDLVAATSDGQAQAANGSRLWGIVMIGKTTCHYRIPDETDHINLAESVGFIAFGFSEEGTPKKRTEPERLDWDETPELGSCISADRRWFNDSASSRAPPTPAV